MSMIDQISKKTRKLMDEMDKEDKNRVQRNPSSGIYDVGRVEPRLVENAAARTFRPYGNVLSVEKDRDAGAVEVQCRMGEPIEENLISEYEDVFQQKLYKQGYDPVDVWTVNEDIDQDHSKSIVEAFTVLVDFEGKGRNQIEESFGYKGFVLGEDESDQQSMDADDTELKSILGLGANQDFDDFEGSPMDAAKQLQAEMGAETAMSQVDLKANVTNDPFLRRVQNAFDDMGVEERDIRDPYPAHGKSTRHRNPSMTSSPAETKDLKTAMGLSDEDDLRDYPGTATEALADVVNEYGADKSKKLLQQAINIGADGQFLKDMAESYNNVLDKMDAAKKKLDMRMSESKDDLLSEASVKGYSEKELERAWNQGNDRGEGFNPDDEIRRWEKLHTTSDGLDIYKNRKGELVGVGDAHGPWAVHLTPYLNESRRRSGRMLGESGGYGEFFNKDTNIHALKPVRSFDQVPTSDQRGVEQDLSGASSEGEDAEVYTFRDNEVGGSYTLVFFPESGFYKSYAGGDPSEGRANSLRDAFEKAQKDFGIQAESRRRSGRTLNEGRGPNFADADWKSYMSQETSEAEYHSADPKTLIKKWARDGFDQNDVMKMKEYGYTGDGIPSDDEVNRFAKKWLRHKESRRRSGRILDENSKKDLLDKWSKKLAKLLPKEMSELNFENLRPDASRIVFGVEGKLNGKPVRITVKPGESKYTRGNKPPKAKFTVYGPNKDIIASAEKRKLSFKEMSGRNSRDPRDMIEWDLGPVIKAAAQKLESRRRSGRTLGEKSDEDPCQEGYTMVGTKTVDGEEVPNCVPNDEVDDYEPEESLDLNGQTIGEDEQLSDVDVEEGKMSEILGVPEDKDIGEAYDGSPEDAVEELVDAVGEDEAASMINYAANISGDDFLEDMQDAISEEDYSESKVKDRLKRSLNEECGGMHNTRDMSIKQVGPTQKYVQNLRHNSVLGRKLAGIFREIGNNEEMAEDLEEMHDICKDMADKIEEGELDMGVESVIEMCSEATTLVRQAAGAYDEMKEV